ncbi:unnamed protein product [Staurois parvus]|uniref:Jumonji domain-containing protein 4 n=1 Tax=Staurois parvus TaxID=386267 RepID=A0ABN9GEZ3_9NEOB|nr:unnamed protein product [Staurois parvus]
MNTGTPSPWTIIALSIWVRLVHGLRSTPTSSVHTAGRRISAGGRSGCSFPRDQRKTSGIAMEISRYDVTSSTLRDPKLYPNYQKCCPPMEVTQEAGEIIFVPSGWHHQVYNVIDTISINHNWVNGCNVTVMWRFLQKELTAVQREIAEWMDTMDNWDQHCQVIMKSCTGIDYTEFYTFLKMIAQPRLEVLETDGVDIPTEDRMIPGPRHALFDLEKIADVLSTMIGDADFQKLDVEALSPPPEQFLHRLRAVISQMSCAVPSI